MTDQQLATRDDRPPMVVLRDKFETRKGELQKMLGSDIKADVFIRAVMTGVAINPEILTCSFQSIWNACLLACRDGLLPDGADAALVAFKGRCSYIPMTAGLLRRFRRSGQFKWVGAGIVRRGEVFEYWIDIDGPHFKHVPGEDSSAAMIACYALATTRDEGRFVAVLTKAEADKRKAMSRATREDSPWQKWTEEMYKKTALRQLSKYLPSARDLMGDDLDEPSPTEPEALTVVASPFDSGSGASPEAPPPGPSPEAAVAVSGGEVSGESDQSAAFSEPTPADSNSQPPAEEFPAEDPIDAAYRRGQEAKKQGMQRRAMPGEYRDAQNTKAALCWIAGWDNSPKPTYGKEE